MEQLQENIKKLEKGLDNPYISTEMKGKLTNKITELKAELEAKQNPPQLSTKDLEARLTIVKEMVKEDPSLKPRLIILKEMIKESKKSEVGNTKTGVKKTNKNQHKSPEQTWKDWTQGERLDFLIKYLTESTPVTHIQLSKKAYPFLPKKVKIELENIKNP